MPFQFADRLPFKEAIDHYRRRGEKKLPTASYSEVVGQQHDLAFVVAGAREDGLLNDLYSAIAQARDEGRGLAEFTARFPEIARQHGWSFNGEPGWRARVIYDTNVTQARRAGELAQRMELVDVRPFWTYRHSPFSRDPRPEHLAWDGITLRWDDPWFKTHHPMCGYGCKCYIESKSQGDLDRAGKTLDAAPAVKWEQRTIGTQAGSNVREVLTPQGVDPGFGHPPGASYLMENMTPQPLTGWDDGPKKPQRTSLPPPVPEKFAGSITRGADPEQQVFKFLRAFDATPQFGKAHIDKTGSVVPISVAMFQERSRVDQPVWKWQQGGSEWKAERMDSVMLLADTIKDPQEIWWRWEPEVDQAGKPTGKHRLKRRFLKAFDVGGERRYVISAFEYDALGWRSLTVFDSQDASYLDKQRAGELIYKKGQP